jgi:hypothetical protein
MEDCLLPKELILVLIDLSEDSRHVYMTCKELFADCEEDHTYWQSRGDGRIATHLPKIPTDISLEVFITHGNLRMVQHICPSLQGEPSDRCVKLFTTALYSDQYDICTYIYKLTCPTFIDMLEICATDESVTDFRRVEHLVKLGLDITMEKSILCAAVSNKNIELIKYLQIEGMDITAILDKPGVMGLILQLKTHREVLAYLTPFISPDSRIWEFKAIYKHAKKLLGSDVIL